MSEEYKGVRLGKMMTNKNGKKTIKLGSDQEGEYAKYNYTVQVRILKGSPKTKEEFKNAEVLHVATNPWVSLITPKPRVDEKTGNVIPSKVEYELQVFKD